MEKNYNFTRIAFKTTKGNKNIKDAIISMFPQAEWNETRQASSFKSLSLCSYLLDTIFENAKDAKQEVAHLFDVYSDNMLVFSLCCPSVVLRLRREPLPAEAHFEIFDFAQYSDTKPHNYYYYDLF